MLASPALNALLSSQKGASAHEGKFCFLFYIVGYQEISDKRNDVESMTSRLREGEVDEVVAHAVYFEENEAEVTTSLGNIGTGMVRAETRLESCRFPSS